jgi:tripartite-type tricarboxylate transporter receptor subunit TctC
VRIRRCAWIGLAGIAAVSAGAVWAQEYPAKTVRIVTAAVGGGADLSARLMAQGISGSLGQQVLVDNRGGGTIAIDTVAKSPPDGYTLLAYGSPLWLTPLMRSSATFDYERDFLPVTLATTAPYFLYVHPSLPVKSVHELVALARARPGEINYGSAGSGSTTHLAAELFKSRAGVNITRVLYKGGGPAANALLAGEVQVMFSTASTGLAQVRAGRLRMLAITSEQPSPLAPNVPTMAAAGLRGCEIKQFTGVFAPARTPATVINRLHQEIVRALSRPDTKERLFNAGLEVVASTPEQLMAAIRSELASLGKVIRDAGIRDD